jgi:tetratricopeptide (TPR) repeat protein
VSGGPLRQLWQDHRDRVALAGLAAAFLGLFAVTTVLTRAYHAREEELAVSWAESGERALAARRPDEAAADFRNALAWSRNNPAYQLRLAQALLASGREEEAQAYLLTLAEREPGHGLVNLELARLFARAGAVPEARRRYHDAVYGVWEKDAPAWRRGARLELVEFLLERGLRGAAAVELLALAEDLPEEAGSYVEVGRLFERAGDPARALEQFRKALALDAQGGDALAGAARAAFALGRYDSAIAYGERARRARAVDGELARALETARGVRALDPDRPRLSSAERTRRTRALLEVVERETARCAAQRPADAAVAGALAAVQTSRARLGRPPAPRDAAARDEALDGAAAALEPVRACGEPATPEGHAAVLVLSRRRTAGG